MEEFIVIFGVFFAVALLVVYIMAAMEFNSIANQKGYPGNKYGWWCFWFPAAGYLMVIALPDRSQKAEATPAKEVFDNNALPEL